MALFNEILPELERFGADSQLMVFGATLPFLKTESCVFLFSLILNPRVRSQENMACIEGKMAFQSELYLLLIRMELFIGAMCPPLVSILVHKVFLMLLESLQQQTKEVK